MSALYDAWVAWLRANPKPSDAANWNQQCAKGQYRFGSSLGWAPQPHITGPNARTVGLNSGWLDTNPATAKIGDWHFWGASGAGHVGRDLNGAGTAVGMVGTTHLDVAIISYGGIASVTTYTRSSGLKYLGHASQYGGGVTHLPAEAAPTPTRKVKSTVNANRRSGPGEKFAESGTALAANTVGNFVAFAHGPVSETQPAGNDVWYQGISGAWFWSGSFTTVDTSGLADKTAQFADPVTPPPVSPPPPVISTPTPPVVVTPLPPVITPPASNTPTSTTVTPPASNNDPVDTPPNWFMTFLKAIAAFFSGYKG